jgi:4-diphosphocytidyl-2-C-methyl-D-erythritol kinase
MGLTSMRHAPAIRVRAHAKINLSLRVLGRRSDGYHELRTMFQSIALHDTIFLVGHDGPLTLTATDPAIPTDRSNIVRRAAEAIWRAADRRGRARGVRIHLVKRIPAGGGLAGGSTDAAAVLRALNVLWRAGLDRTAIERIGRDLGADVPFFLRGGTALGLDRGDRIVPLPDIAARWVVLLTPAFAVSTPAAFEWFDRRAKTTRARKGRAATGPAAEVANDLEPVVIARHPEIASLKRALLRSGARAAAMSGSGSTVFGVFASENAARTAADRLARTCAALVTRFLSRREFQRVSRPAAVRGLPRTARIG